MKRQRALAICVGSIIGCWISGCASQSSTAPALRPATAASSASATSPAQEPSPAAPLLSWRSPETPAPAAAIGNATTPRRDHARLIGLFGEFEHAGPHAGSSLDAGINLRQITFATEGACIDPDVDRTGSWIAFASTMHRSASDIYIKSVAPPGKTLTQVTSDPADDVMPAFSPDGKLIAFASNRAGNWDIYTTTIDGGTTVQITSDSDHELHPTWSPDGKTIAYCKFGAQSQRWEIWTVDVTNPGARNFLDYGVFPQWCPDPARPKILFQRARQRGSRDYSIWTVDVINGQAKYPTEIVSAANAALINPAWSPDGSRIVFVSVVEPAATPDARPAQADLWMINLDGTGRTSLTNGMFANFQPAWASDGFVYFVSDRSGSDNIWAVAANGNQGRVAPTQVTGVTNGGGAGGAASESHP